jgi:putative poly(3-hydroxybutyrate) depolymerase
MKKYRNLLLLIPFLVLFSCMEDESEYSSQEKENVQVDQVTVDTTDTDEELPEGQLVPGLHLVKLKVLQGQDSVERQFKYYMPVSTDASKPISLLFEFHGSYEFEAGEEVPNPISGISETHVLNQKAIKENYIICYPAGWPEFQQDSSGAVNWAGENYTRSLPFIDAMLKYFTQDNEPQVDPNRIYSTGQSSGAILSFSLALHRPEQFAAITPRAGQSASTEPFPSRAVPVRVFAGEKDKTVVHSAVITNMTKWAEEIGGYFAADMQMDSTVFEDYADVTIRYWHGGKADYEIYSLAGIDHSISVSECADAMFEFQKNHTLDNAAIPLFITTSIKEINAQCGETISFKISYTEDATLGMTNTPKGWDIQLQENEVILKAPADYFGDIDRKGSITFTVTQGTQAPVSCEVSYNLNSPKTYFEVGDIYYNENFDPIGVVVWVNQSNIREAKIISPKKPGQYGSIWYCGNGEGLGLDFQTPDRKNGYQNTQDMLARNNTFAEPYTADNAAFVWASEYSVAGEKGWYLPAIEELAAAHSNLTLINEALTSIGGQTLDGSVYSSTTLVENGAQKKTFYLFNFKTGAEETKLPYDNNSEYLGYITVRAMKTVTKN